VGYETAKASGVNVERSFGVGGRELRPEQGSEQRKRTVKIIEERMRGDTREEEKV